MTRQNYLTSVLEAQAIDGQLRAVAMEETDKAFSTAEGEDVNTAVFMGFEWEVIQSPTKVLEVIKEAVTTPLGHLLNFRRDCSKVEMVSVPGTLNFHKKFMEEEFFKRNYDRMITARGSSADSGAGIHVHVDKEAFTEASLKRFMAFIINPVNRKFIEYIGNRSLSKCASSIANAAEFKFVPHPSGKGKLLVGTDIKLDNALVQRGCDSKGWAINTGRHCITSKKPKGTIECRFFQSVHTKEKLFKNLEFVEAAVLFSRKSSYNKLTVSNFIKFVEANQSRYPNLMNHMVFRPLEIN